MNKLLLILLGVALSLQVNAQDDAISTLFSKYADDDSFTKVNISSKMFQLFTHIEGSDEEEKEVLETISGLKGLKILSKNEISNGKQLYKEALKAPGKSFEELMSVKDGDEDLTFFIKESGGMISELLMISGGESNFVILSLVGDIDLNKVAQLSRSMSIGGMDQLQKIEDKEQK